MLKKVSEGDLKNCMFLQMIHGDALPDNITKEISPAGVVIYRVGEMNIKRLAKTTLSLLS